MIRIVVGVLGAVVVAVVIAFGIATWLDHKAAEKAAIISPENRAATSTGNMGSGANGAGDASGGGNH
jgi:hypothetical protein